MKIILRRSWGNNIQKSGGVVKIRLWKGKEGKEGGGETSRICLRTLLRRERGPLSPPQIRRSRKTQEVYGEQEEKGKSEIRGKRRKE